MVDEKELVTKALSGSLGAFEALVRQYEHLVFFMVRQVVSVPEDIEDVCQEVFMKIHRNLHRFRFQSRLSTWIAQIAYRSALNHVKKYRRLRYSVDLSGAETLADPNESADAAYPDRRAMVQAAIQALPEAFRQMVLLYHIQEFSYEEIARITGQPVGTVKSYLFRGRKLLRERLEIVFLNEEK